MGALYQAMSNESQYFREQYRRYFETKEPDCILYLYNIVQMLIKNPQINDVEQKLGKEEYDRLAKSIKKYMPLYNYSMQIRASLMKMKDVKYESEDTREKVKLLLDEQKKVAMHMPVIRDDVITFFFQLVNNTTLRNLAIPKRETRIPQQRPTAGEQ